MGRIPSRSFGTAAADDCQQLGSGRLLCSSCDSMKICLNTMHSLCIRVNGFCHAIDLHISSHEPRSVIPSSANENYVMYPLAGLPELSIITGCGSLYGTCVPDNVIWDCAASRRKVAPSCQRTRSGWPAGCLERMVKLAAEAEIGEER